MHMADALLSPAVGGAMWAVSAGAVAWSARRVARDGQEDRTALMGVLGAFVFAAQMINFSIPGTGSSGHLGGGLLLAVLLGPYAAFLTIASVLIVQALFFADGGLLALGCNLFNMGFLACFVAYPLVYRAIAGGRSSRNRIWAGSMAAGIGALALGALAVVLETTLSGISDLPFASFLAAMIPIHLAIGVVEGGVTAAVILFVREARPELFDTGRVSSARPRARRLVAALALVAALTAGVLSWFASRSPDGLEWSVARVAGSEDLAAPTDGIHAELAQAQAAVAPMPDYDFKPSANADASAGIVQPGQSAAGLLGASLTLALAGGLGLALRRRRLVPIPASCPADERD